MSELIQRIDHYRIVSRIGRGGMGEVYRAADERLGREVALKLLPLGVALGSDRTERRHARLLREAQAASALNHPGIVTLHGVGTWRGRLYLVMELIDGERVSALAARGVPVKEALRIAADAADALSAAHARGILHRDIKSDNLMITREGRVKLVDFGLAKLREAPPAVHLGAADPSPTAETLASNDERDVSAETLPSFVEDDDEGAPAAAPRPEAPGDDGDLTRAGELIGTPAYMAPEQADGTPADAQTEVFSLGVVLYELLTGRRPWAGKTARGTLAAMREVPLVPPSKAAPARRIPASADAVVARALAIDRPARLHDMAAFAEAARGAMPGARRGARHVARAAGAGVLLASAIGAAIAVRGARAPRASAPESAARGSIAAPITPENLRRVTFDEGCEEFPWWTPDGRTIVYDGASGRDTHLFALDLATGARRSITNEPGWQLAPSVSPDGETLAYLFLATGEHATYLSALDGSSRRRLSAADVVRPSWSPDGRFVWIGGRAGPERVDARTGEVTRRLRPPDWGLTLNVLELPDGRVITRVAEGAFGLVLFPAGQDKGDWLWRAELESVLDLAPDGRSVLAAKATQSHATELWRVPLDGSPPARVPGSGVTPTKGLRVSPDGRRVTWSTCRAQYDLPRLAPGPQPGTLVAAPRAANDWTDMQPSAIPGTSQVLLLSTRMGDLRPCVVDMAERAPARCLDMGGLDVGSPSPSRDGRWFSFHTPSKGVFVAPLDGSAPPRMLVAAREGERQDHAVISPDGREVYFSVLPEQGPSRVEVVPFEGGAPRRFLDGGARHASFSPRGDAMAFLMGEQRGKATIVLMDLATGKRRRLAPELGEGNVSSPIFSASGARAAIRRGVNELFELDVEGGGVLRRLDVGTDQIQGLTYVGDDLVISRLVWVGDLWVADLAQR